MISESKIRELAEEYQYNFGPAGIRGPRAFAAIDYTDGFHAALALVREIVRDVAPVDPDKQAGSFLRLVDGGALIAEILGALEVGEKE